MTPPSRPDRILLEFDEFRVDPVRRRLYRQGELVAVTPKALSLLLLLIERRGNLVEKDFLLKELWPDTFVTEANLTQNLSALRKALGERANDRRLIVTVPGRGYTFVGEVREVANDREATGEIQLPVLPPRSETEVPSPGPPPEAILAPAAASPPPASAGETPQPLESSPAARIVPPITPIAPIPSAPPIAPTTPAPPFAARRRWLLPLAALAALVAIGGLAWWVWVLRHRPAAPAPAVASRLATARPAIAVLGFKNLSGRPEDAWLATALGEMLSTELGASPTARVISTDRVAQLRRSVPFSYDQELSSEQLERLHSLLGADLVIVGSYLVSPLPSGGKIRLDVRILRAPSGEVVASVPILGSKDPIDFGAQAGAELRQHLGLSAPSPEDARAAAALQPKTERAARLYANGLERLRASDVAGARDLLAQAVEAQPASALFRSVLSQALTELGSDAEAQRQAGEALRLSAGLPREQRLEIEAHAHEARKEWERASEIYRSLFVLHPEQLDHGLHLVQTLSIGGRGGEAAAVIAELRKMPSPQRDDPRIDLAEAQNARRLGNPDLEMSAARAAEGKGARLKQPQMVAEALLWQGDAFYTKGAPEQSIQALERAQKLFAGAGNKAAVARTLNRIAASSLDMGELRQATEKFEQARQMAEELGSDSLAASQIGALGVTALRQGDLARALRLCRDSYHRFVTLGDRFYETRMLFFVGLILARSGETVEAQERLNEVLNLARAAANRADEAQTQAALGNLLVDAGRFAEGRKKQEEGFARAKASGDPFLAANYLSALGVTSMLQGDFTAAQRALDLALGDKLKVKDRVGQATILLQIAALAERRGDLQIARSTAERALETAHSVGAELDEAVALRRLGRLNLIAGDLAQSRHRLTAGLALARRLSAGREVADLQVDLARLSLAEGRSGEALALARQAVAWLRAHGLVGAEGRALLAVADAALAAGRRDEAGAAASRAFYLSTSPTDEDRELKLASITRDALVAAARGSYGEAAGHLGGMMGSAEKAGEIPIWLEGRAVQALLLLKRGDTVGADAAFRALARDATARGYLLLARRASQQTLPTSLRPLG